MRISPAITSPVFNTRSRMSARLSPCVARLPGWGSLVWNRNLVRHRNASLPIGWQKRRYIRHNLPWNLDGQSRGSGLTSAAGCKAACPNRPPETSQAARRREICIVAPAIAGGRSGVRLAGSRCSSGRGRCFRSPGRRFRANPQWHIRIVRGRTPFFARTWEPTANFGSVPPASTWRFPP